MFDYGLKCLGGLKVEKVLMVRAVTCPGPRVKPPFGMLAFGGTLRKGGLREACALRDREGSRKKKKKHGLHILQGFTN